MQSAQFQIVAVVKFFVLGLETIGHTLIFILFHFLGEEAVVVVARGSGGGRGERGGKGDSRDACQAVSRLLVSARRGTQKKKGTRKAQGNYGTLVCHRYLRDECT